VLCGVLNTALEEKVNLVNAGTIASARGLLVEELTRRRERGFPDTLEVAAVESDGSREFSVEGTVLHGTSPRTLTVDGIEVEAPLEGTLLFLRNRDVPGVIGQIGTILGSQGVNIATFALGRREAVRGAEAIALVRLDGEVPDSILQPIRGVSAILECQLVRLPGGSA
jgi:D-3-phosphoglycerate dehydrogenase